MILIATSFLAITGCGQDTRELPRDLIQTCSKSCSGSTATKAVACQVSCNDGYIAKCACDEDPELAKCSCQLAAPL
jgi:hypothetical protein